MTRLPTLTITLRSTGDRQRDILRLRRIHGLLIARPGKDTFLIVVHESRKAYTLSFPNDPIAVDDETLAALRKVGILDHDLVIHQPLGVSA